MQWGGVFLRLVLGGLSRLHAVSWAVFNTATVMFLGQILFAVNLFRIFLMVNVSIPLVDTDPLFPILKSAGNSQAMTPGWANTKKWKFCVYITVNERKLASETVPRLTSHRTMNKHM